MREIKFRAWVEKFPDGTSGYLKMQKGVSVGKWFSNYQLNHPEYFTTLEQFTGIKDKNGVEIFEGDIVRMTTKVTLDTVGSGTVFEDEVAFNSGRFYIKGDASYFSLGERMDSDIEIIGNIHENGEILK